MIAAIYIRVSTDDQVKGFSLTTQLELMTDYCKRNHTEIYKVYADEGISGQKETRPAFQEMIRDAEKGLFSSILVYKFNRFARSVEINRRVKTALKKHNVKVISITEPIEDSPMGFFMEGISELIAEYDVRNLSVVVKDNMIKRAETGKHMGQMPFGYVVRNGQVFINESQANIVKEIFNKYLSGWGHMKIVRWLNESRIPSYEGIINAWQTFQVSSILRNEKYIGRLRWDGNVYESETIPKIIDEKIFYTVQEQLGQKKSRFSYRASNYDKFELLGILFCGECGRRMRIKSNNAKRKTHYYAYACYDALMYRNNCTHTTLHRQDKIEFAVLDGLKDILKSVKRNFKVAEKKNNIDNIYESRLKKVDTELLRAKQAYLDTVFTLEEYKEIKSKLESEKILIQHNIIKSSKDSTDDSIDILKTNINSALTAYKKAETPMERKRHLLGILEKITVSKDGRLNFTFNTPN